MTGKHDTERKPLKGRTAVVCGGSQGIGRETAREFVRLGGSVLVIARRPEPLEEAAGEMRALAREGAQFVETAACDAADMERMKPLLEGFVGRRGVPDFLINVVGFAFPQYVKSLTLEDFRRSMDVNYYGQLVPILILLPFFMAARKGHIANVSSMMGYFGIMGYAAYAPTKFALVGLTECLRNELKPYGITFSVLYPPDTQTPGYEIENRTKPKECLEMSASVKLLSSRKVAGIFVEGLIRKRYAIMPGEAGFVWRVNRLFPWLVRWIVDLQYRQARKRLAQKR